MRLPVCAYKPCPVNSKNHMKLLHTYIMQDLIYSTLQKR